MTRGKRLREIPLHLMVLPGVLCTIIFSYIPMMGIIIAFQKFVPTLGIFKSKFVGLENIRYMLELPNIYSVIWNTVFIAVMKIIAGMAIPIIFALLLNEIGNKFLKRSVQTIIYLPFFLSWVILGGILIDILSPSTGFVNQIMGAVGIKPVFFLGDEKWFPFTLILSDTWKNFGYNTVIYLAALTAIDPTLYEASIVDGANRWKQTLHVTIPGMMPIIMLMAVLSLGNVLNAGFEQVFNLYSPQVYSTGDIIDTLVYRIGLVNFQYGLSTAIGLFKSLISFGLIVLSNKLAYKYAGYRVF